MPQSLASLLGVAAVLLICAATAMVGGTRERAAAGVTALGLLASLTVQSTAPSWVPVLRLGLVDLAVLLAFIALAWRPRGGWPLWAVGVQGVTVALDLLRAADRNMAPYTYLTAVAILGYALAAVIAYAGWSSWAARR